MNNREQGNNNVEYCGSLTNSSYFDKPTKIICPKTNALIPNPNQTESSKKPNSADTNLFVRSCVFSNDSTHLAWTCGYSIVKLMKFRNSTSVLKRSSSAISDLEKTNFNMGDIAEIDCMETVKSVAFGSSNRKDTLRRIHFRPQKKTNNRFNIGDNNLLLAVGLATGNYENIFFCLCFLILNWLCGYLKICMNLVLSVIYSYMCIT